MISNHQHTIDIGDIWDQISVRLIFRVLPLVILLSPQVNAIGDRLLHSQEFKYQELTEEPAQITVSAHKIEPIKPGDKIAGFTVSSGYGKREAPCPGCSTEHPAIDVATPTGTPLHAISDITVVCKSDPISGKYAEFEFQEILHQALHLDTCTPGSYTYGQKFASTGSTGRGTGPHLDFRVKQHGQRVMPSRDVLWAMLDPTAFTVKPNKTEPDNVKPNLDVTFDIHNGTPNDEVTATFHGLLNLGVTNPYQISYILATAQHESASFSTTKEIGRGEGCGESTAYDGWPGRGLVQLTWQNNYEKAKEKLGFINLTNEQFCQQLVEQSDIAITILIRGMMEGWFTGLSLDQYIAGDTVDYYNARRVINGTNRAEHIAKIAKGYEPDVKQWLKEYGY
jgi:murein DD-endopeptidase MepM/ murein hydrolase activator NlpD